MLSFSSNVTFLKLGGRRVWRCCSHSCTHARHCTTGKSITPHVGHEALRRRGGEELQRGGARRSHPASTDRSSHITSSGSTTQSDGSQLKVRRKDPWGVQQLRDSWSEDAMSKREMENMSERIHREYRYHPDEFRRRHVKIVAALTIPAIIFGMSAGYYFNTGRHIWTADPQHILNVIRSMDTSPRSALYAYQLEEMLVLPPHVAAHRAAHRHEREEAERNFHYTRSAFLRPTEYQRRQMEADALAEAEAAADGAPATAA